MELAGGRRGYSLAIYSLAIMTQTLFSRWLAGALVFSQLLTPALGQTPVSSPRLDPALVTYFSGEWTGEGAFAAGRPIAADLSFHLSLDSAWLVYEHRDRSPNQYKATSYWGVDGQSGLFVAYAFDNFHGHRQFASNGWADGKLILSARGAGRAGVVFEHFIFEARSDTQFKMTYETSPDGISWRLGDWLVFHRVVK